MRMTIVFNNVYTDEGDADNYDINNGENDDGNDSNDTSVDNNDDYNGVNCNNHDNKESDIDKTFFFQIH